MKKILTLSILMIMFVACDEDDPFPYYGPSLPIVLFTSPATESEHDEAVKVVSWVTEFNAFSTSLQDFSDVEPTESDSTHTWSYAEGGVTYTLTGTLLSNSGYLWKLALNGTLNDTTTYNNWTAYEGTTDSTRRNAVWALYEENTTVKSSDFLWTITDLSLVGTLNVYSNGAITNSTVLTDNDNGTGKLEIFENGVLRYRAIWISNGSGQYEYYDEQGAITSEGQWS